LRSVACPCYTTLEIVYIFFKITFINAMESFMMLSSNRFKSIVVLLLGILVLFSMNGCEKTSKTAVSEVHWDRDMCSRCVMVISDRQNTVQVINAKTGKKNVFDDLGCMVIWSQENSLNLKDKIWVNDVISGEWIDAKEAFYDAGNITPMGYGFSAHKLKSDIVEGKEVLDYEEVLKRVLKR